MNEQQRLFLVQARSDYGVFLSFDKPDGAKPESACHALHYLQMSAEKLAKAQLWAKGFPGKVHAAFVLFLRALMTDDQARLALGIRTRVQWQSVIRGVLPIASQIERLAPTLAGNGPNAEYPWPPDEPTAAPAEYQFPVWADLHQKPSGRNLLSLLRELFMHAEEYC